MAILTSCSRTALVLIMAVAMIICSGIEGIHAARNLKEKEGNHELKTTLLTFFMHGEEEGGNSPTAKTDLSASESAGSDLALTLSAGGGLPVYDVDAAAAPSPVKPISYNDFYPRSPEGSVSVFEFLQNPTRPCIFEGPLREGHDPHSAVVGKVNGYHIPSDEDEDTTFLLSLTVTFWEDEVDFPDEYECCGSNSIEFSGVDNVALPEREIGVTGGTGKFEYASGHALLETLSPNLLKFSIHLVNE